MLMIDIDERLIAIVNTCATTIYFVFMCFPFVFAILWPMVDGWKTRNQFVYNYNNYQWKLPSGYACMHACAPSVDRFTFDRHRQYGRKRGRKKKRNDENKNGQMASALNTNDEDELELVRARLIMVELQFALACPICSLAVDESSRGESIIWSLSLPLL